VDQIEAEAEASTELAGELTGDTLDRKFKALEGAGVGADSALAELKAKMGLAAPEARAALPASSSRVAVEEEEAVEVGSGVPTSDKTRS
jgi:phage shock protein A